MHRSFTTTLTLNHAPKNDRRRGGALLTVLWLSAALSAIAFSVAATVRSESERASTLADGVRTYYLAAGAVERAIMKVESEMAKSPDLMMRFSFPNGESVVELIPETGKLSLNIGTAQEFNSLLLALGAAPEQAAQVASAVVQWRGAAGGAPAGGTGSPTTATSPYDSSQSQTFQPRYSSFLNEEEALYLSGMTPDLFHGNYVRTAQGLARLGALKDCVSVFGTTGRFEVNSADPALLVSLGMSPDAANQIVALRRTKRIMDLNEVAGYAGQAANKLRTGGNTIYTFRATARLRLANGRLSDLRRTVAAQVKFQQAGSFPPHHILRWHEMPYSEVSQWP